MYEVKDEVIRNIKNEFANELYERDYSYSEIALDKIINEWIARKQDLLELFSKHPLWNPDKLLIQFDQDYSRKIELNELHKFCNWLFHKVTTTWENSLADLNCAKEEDIRRKNVIVWMNEKITNQFFDDSMKEEIDKMNSYNENYKLRTNMKSSKAIGKICREEGWDKLEGYNTKYAALCDNLNPIKVKRHTVISLNPLDFLLMSNGDTWCSCHYIGDDIDDAGCYSSGTISYMLDECSFVFYTVNADFDETDIELAEKAQRQIFGYRDEAFIQSRLYPQANDSGAEAIYDDIRNIVQKIIADCLEKPNLWVISKNSNKIKEVVEDGSRATCYPDWHRGNPGSNHCCLSTLKGRIDSFKKITLGAEPICISCGRRHTYEKNISCCENQSGYYCEECGGRISEDDVIWVGDYPYCCDCAIYCEECGCGVSRDDAYRVDDVWYCEDCIDQVATPCNYCGEYEYNDCIVTTEEANSYCENCAEEKVRYCDECGECHETDNIIYDEVTEKWYCKECYEDLLEERESEEELYEQAE